MGIKHNTSGSKLLVIIVILVAIRFWSFTPLMTFGNLNRYLSLALEFVLIFSFITFFKRPINKFNSYSSVKYILFSLSLSAISALFFSGQSLWDSFNATMILSLGYILYFYLCKTNFSVKYLLDIILFISIVWTCLEIVQQFTYPTYYFAGREEGWWNGELENRMGLWRFYIWGVDFVILCYCHRLQVTINRFNIRNFIFALIPFLGLACYCSRKHLIVLALVTIIIILFSQRKKLSMASLLIIGIFIIGIFYFKDSFVEMNDIANKAQGEGEDFIRYLAGEYFLKFFGMNNPLYTILGAGIPGGNSILNNEIIRLQEFYGFYQQDVGLIGYYSWCGIIGVLSIIYCIYMTVRKFKLLDTYLIAFCIAKIVLIIFDFWAMWQVGIVAYSIFLYLSDKSIILKSCSYENRDINLS
ncbi:hypothetical protein [Marseilla massiliensis]|uniref:O-antigen polymerase n=1 Tax=Marseilla massiliensis TaxID=1841864 RepID=A0A938WV00_9BACT|nr:hypothetical protein [Marseilla massiliensis]MBM6674903.1 hypothetical protein [Marseilla massiliensis]